MKDILQKYIFKITLFILGLLVFYKGIFTLDPDFGWHLKEGGLEFANGILKTDPFSYTMPSFWLIDHEWLSNVLIFIFYSYFGKYILALIFTLIYIFSLYISIPKEYKNFAIVNLALGGSLIANLAGVRTQVETWLFLAILLKIIFDQSLWQKWKYFIPLIFFPWVNLHGGFAVGIATLLVLFFAKSLDNRKISFTELKIFLASVFVTFLNPYGPRIWYEIWLTVSDLSLSSKIVEWMPGVFVFDPSLCLLFAISTSFIFYYRKKFKIFEISIYIFFTILAILHLRHIPLWVISSIILTPKALFYFFEEVNARKESIKRFAKIKKPLIIVLFLVFTYEVILGFLYSYNLNNYPIKAIKFLETQKLKGNIFATYDIGGYLIWKFPQKKVFIDGRMPSWRREGNFPNESNNAWNDYVKMTNFDFFKSQLSKYNIEYVLVFKENKTEENKIPKKFKFLLNLFFDQKNWRKDFTDNLNKAKMKKIYDDGKYVIYKI